MLLVIKKAANILQSKKNRQNHQSKILFWNIAKIYFTYFHYSHTQHRCYNKGKQSPNDRFDFLFVLENHFTQLDNELEHFKLENYHIRMKRTILGRRWR